MTTYYIEENGKIVLFDEDKLRLTDTLAFMPQYAGLEILETENLIVDGIIYTQEEYEEEQAQKEQARIIELFMTRGDFFNGTIYAWGADEDDLKPVIEQALTALQFTDLEKKGAMNYYKNALNFYRKHPLFTMLTDVAIPLTETTFVTVTKDEWNKFFDEVNKGNDEAYKELPAPQEIPTVTPESDIVDSESEQVTNQVSEQVEPTAAENSEVEEVVVSEMENTTENTESEVNDV